MKLNAIILPRQARDKHRKNRDTKHDAFFSSQAEQVAAEEATAAALARGEAPPVPAAEADAKALADAAVRFSHSLLPHAYPSSTSAT